MVAVQRACAAWLICCSASAAEPPPLANNPFARPPSASTLDTGRVDQNRSASGINLLATMVSSTDRLANVGGRIIRQGDEINGYRLLQIHENRAVFERNNTQLTVYVKPQLDQDNDS